MSQRYRTMERLATGILILACVLMGVSGVAGADPQEVTAYLQKPDPKIGKDRDVGVGFDYIQPATTTLKVILQAPPEGWKIRKSECKEKEGTVTWTLKEVAPDGSKHVWEGTGLTINKGHAALFHTVLTKDAGAGEPPTCKASVADLDLDADTKGLLSGGWNGHWSPDGSDLEDELEDYATPKGFHLPPSLYPGTSFPENCNNSNYKILEITIRPKWKGEPQADLVGDLWLFPPAQISGLAFYKPDGWRLTVHYGGGNHSNIPVPIEDEGIVKVKYRVLTNDNFVVPEIAEGQFKWYTYDPDLGNGSIETAVDRINISPIEWKTWPGGQNDKTLNPIEKFESKDFGFSDGEQVKWDVSKGGVAAGIVDPANPTQPPTTTATNASEIYVRYDTKSPTSGVGDVALIKATKNNCNGMKMRTVFSVTCTTLNVSERMDADNQLFHVPGTGTDNKKAEFNYDGENGATRVAAKMEATFSFSPTGIDWQKRGVTFGYIQEGDCRFNRKRIATVLGQLNAAANRAIQLDDEEWCRDGEPDPQDAQYPDAQSPNKAFRTDSPGFDADAEKQHTFRVDFQEMMEWVDDYAQRWTRITPLTGATWKCNETGVLPDCAKGGTNNHSAGVPADDVSNHKPVAQATATPNPVGTGQVVTLDGSGSADADNDTLTYKWTQTEGTTVTLSSDTAQKPTFTAPTTAGTLKFSLKVTDITKDLHHHNPGNAESDAATVTVTVQ